MKYFIMKRLIRRLVDFLLGIYLRCWNFKKFKFKFKSKNVDDMYIKVESIGEYQNCFLVLDFPTSYFIIFFLPTL